MAGLSGFAGNFGWGSKSAGYVFWSGGEEAMGAAANYALATGGKTLEMTMGGKIMTTLDPFLSRSISNDIWKSLSMNFAYGARGSVNAFQNVYFKRPSFRFFW
ncbi:hypothetical protein [Methylovulum psychrotolerans]|uniref:hypothetical protein n=1 Tax=Methylovulum psychrotolerans TaxID=1704499 RepID=UPI001B805C98|nr:hypothetical protein [Methylovulum psychrotolerans]